MMLLLWHADVNGRVWLGIQAIANKVGAGSLRTVRNALEMLVRDGWLRSSSQTWASLTAEQTAAGRPVPRRGDVGQAPNLYVLLDGRGNLATTFEVPSPGLFRQGSPLQKCKGVPLADPQDDPDPKGSRSRIERVERVPNSTHISSKSHAEDQRWLDGWNVIVEAHTNKTKLVYGLPPLPPDLKRDQRQALAECLDGAARDVQEKLHVRSGEMRDVRDVRDELATRVMQLYFKRDNEHLRRVKHALRDLPREFHARITEAMQMLLRETHDDTKPRKMQAETKFVETNQTTKQPASTSATEAAQAITAREARRLFELLSGSSIHEDLTKSAASEDKPLLRAAVVERDCLDQPSHDKPIPRDKPSVAATRTGAPRWGAVGPRCIKVRNVLDTHHSLGGVGTDDG